ncbi:YqgE/AlgH family protein [Arcicella sp. LKC2W]|uniref:YqgE/AlgH family protein n=1 Tax=Arcicella sp. LKC2W TaxID=2984198 RepID=UPI002B2141F1|nr:YqgE/AlgH family protein [Arcicella sp. LKC2W]MEA5460096.1 YqgE/AlgH family protein [Arcicella sp. LKC2W]
MRNISKGTVLISEPFLGDPNFERSVVLICEHETTQGSFGLILNQTSKLFLADVLEENIYPDIPLFVGGPVQHNTLHYLHRRPDVIDGGIEIMKGVTWGGNFQQVKELLNNGVLSAKDIRCFIGYSGWEIDQLNNELKKDSWIVSKTTADVIFDTPAETFWRSILKEMGGDFKVMANYPIDPRLN